MTDTAKLTNLIEGLLGKLNPASGKPGAGAPHSALPAAGVQAAFVKARLELIRQVLAKMGEEIKDLTAERGKWKEWGEQRCHDMKILRGIMDCDGSDLPQLLAAWDAMKFRAEQAEIVARAAREFCDARLKGDRELEDRIYPGMFSAVGSWTASREGAEPATGNRH